MCENKHCLYQGNYVVVGPPGTGKTTFLARRVKRIVDHHGEGDKDHSPVLICSLTRTAAAEIAGRTSLNPDAVATIHAHALRSQPPLKLLGAEEIKNWNEEMPAYELSQTPGRNTEELLASTGGSLGDDTLGKYNLLRNKMVPREKWDANTRYFASQWEDFKTCVECKDFTDLLTYASEFPPLSPHVIIVDEAQDTSRLAMSVIQRWAQHADALMIVGDPWQSLFVWAGADPALLTDGSVEGQRGVLSQSYRIPARVHKYAVRWVESQLSAYKPIDYHPRKEKDVEVDGNVLSLQAWWDSPGRAIDIAKINREQGRSTMILTTTNKLIVPTVEELRLRHLPFSNPWRPSNRYWNPLEGTTDGLPTIDRVLAFTQPLVEGKGKWTIHQALLWTSLTKNVLKRGARAKMDKETRLRCIAKQEMEEWFQPAALNALTLAMDKGLDSSLEWLKSTLRTKGKRGIKYILSWVWSCGTSSSLSNSTPFKGGEIYVGTIHSVKGGEADDVVIFPDLSYPAFEAWDSWGTDERDSVVRMFYVGFTRARQRLFLCQSNGAKSVGFPITENVEYAAV